MAKCNALTGSAVEGLNDCCHNGTAYWCDAIERTLTALCQLCSTTLLQIYIRQKMELEIRPCGEQNAGHISVVFKAIHCVQTI